MTVISVPAMMISTALAAAAEAERSSIVFSPSGR